MISLIIPGMSQFGQGRMVTGLAHLAFAVFLWCFGMGWIMHVVSFLSARQWEQEKEKHAKHVRAHLDAYMVASEDYGRRYDHGYQRQPYQ